MVPGKGGLNQGMLRKIFKLWKVEIFFLDERLNAGSMNYEGFNKYHETW